MSRFRAVDTRKGLSAQVFDYKMDYLLMELDQLDNKLVRKTEEMIGEQFSNCRGKLLRIGSEMACMNRSVESLEKNLDAFFKATAETALPESQMAAP